MNLPRPGVRHKIAALAFLTAATAWAGGCGKDAVGPPPPPPPPPPPGPPIVSNPVLSLAPVSAAASFSLTATADIDVAYITLPPGSAPAGRLATITNLRSGDATNVAVAEGGFDPTAIPAIVGDNISIVVRDASGTVVFEPPLLVVTAKRAPILVRTNPPPRKRDVPLNSRITVVFSEPVDAGTITSSTIQLRTGSQSVAGIRAFRDSEHVAVLFVPNAPLSPATTYTLEVSGEIRDLDGDSLGTPVTIEFTTATSGGYEEFFVEGGAGRIDQWANDSVRGVGDSVLVIQDVTVHDGSGAGIEGVLLRFRVSTGKVEPETTTSGLGGSARIRWIFDGTVGRPPSDSIAELSACASNSAARCDMYWPIVLVGFNPR